MRITCVGGGPAGLYFAILMKKLDRDHEITVYEAPINRADLTYVGGETVGVAEGARAACSNTFDDVVRIDVARTKRGCLLFPRSGSADPGRFRLALESVPVEAGGIWNLTG